jgi:hypothetical protein
LDFFILFFQSLHNNLSIIKPPAGRVLTGPRLAR